MSIIKRNESSTTKAEDNLQREFIGRAWINDVTLKDGTKSQVINIQLDNGIDEVTINKAVKGIQLWPNAKREGKRDADYRLSILIPKE